MEIENLDAFTFPVPFKVVFRHASASRSRAENVIVAVTSACGQSGYGEGCPRNYVTGESQETARAFIDRHRNAITRTVTDIESLRGWIEVNRREIDANPAAFCAIEIAVLDLLGKIRRQPLEGLLGLPPLTGRVMYTAVLGHSPYLAFWWKFRRYRRAGFRDFKIKLSGHARRDRRKLRLLNGGNGEAPRVRLDANNHWASASDCIRHIENVADHVFAVEEPLKPFDIDGFRAVGEQCSTQIVLDESAANLEHLAPLRDPDRWIVNIRVSKMGGIVRSLEMIRAAGARGIDVIVGAQVGETSILTRSALCLMHAAGENLVASEGAFGTHLLQEDLASPCLMFGKNGYLDTGTVDFGSAGGLGLDINRAVLV